jgi:class 3 adenylate cyclase
VVFVFCVSWLFLHTLLFGVPLDQRTLFLTAGCALVMPPLWELPHALHLLSVLLLLAPEMAALLFVDKSDRTVFPWVTDYDDIVGSAVIVGIFFLLGMVPHSRTNHLHSQQQSTLIGLAAESRAQMALLKRVIPEVFLEQLLNDTKRLTSPPIDDVTVMFVEVMQTRMDARGQRAAPVKLGYNVRQSTLAILAHVFRILDRVTKRNHVHKVETITSEFMCVSGLPRALPHAPNTAYVMVLAALDMLREVRRESAPGGRLEALIAKHEPGMQIVLQIGINSGPTVEAILGKKYLPRWKLFGDTVNTASRMKSTGLPGRIHVSRNTRNLLMRDAAWVVSRARTARSPRVASHSVYATASGSFLSSDSLAISPRNDLEVVLSDRRSDAMETADASVLGLSPNGESPRADQSPRGPQASALRSMTNSALFVNHITHKSHPTLTHGPSVVVVVPPVTDIELGPGRRPEDATGPNSGAENTATTTPRGVSISGDVYSEPKRDPASDIEAVVADRKDRGRIESHVLPISSGAEAFSLQLPSARDLYPVRTSPSINDNGQFVSPRDIAAFTITSDDMDNIGPDSLYYAGIPFPSDAFDLDSDIAQHLGPIIQSQVDEPSTSMELTVSPPVVSGKKSTDPVEATVKRDTQMRKWVSEMMSVDHLSMSMSPRQEDDSHSPVSDDSQNPSVKANRASLSSSAPALAYVASSSQLAGRDQPSLLSGPTNRNVSMHDGLPWSSQAEAPGIGPVPLTEGDILLARAAGFFLRPRAPISVKGKGTMCTYFVELTVPDSLEERYRARAEVRRETEVDEEIVQVALDQDTAFWKALDSVKDPDNVASPRLPIAQTGDTAAASWSEDTASRLPLVDQPAWTKLDTSQLSSSLIPVPGAVFINDVSRLSAESSAWIRKHFARYSSESDQAVLIERHSRNAPRRWSGLGMTSELHTELHSWFRQHGQSFLVSAADAALVDDVEIAKQDPAASATQHAKADPPEVAAPMSTPLVVETQVNPGPNSQNESNPALPGSSIQKLSFAAPSGGLEPPSSLADIAGTQAGPDSELFDAAPASFAAFSTVVMVPADLEAHRLSSAEYAPHPPLGKAHSFHGDPDLVARGRGKKARAESSRRGSTEGARLTSYLSVGARPSIGRTGDAFGASVLRSMGLELATKDLSVDQNARVRNMQTLTTPQGFDAGVVNRGAIGAMRVQDNILASELSASMNHTYAPRFMRMSSTRDATLLKPAPLNKARSMLKLSRAQSLRRDLMPGTAAAVLHTLTSRNLSQTPDGNGHPDISFLHAANAELASRHADNGDYFGKGSESDAGAEELDDLPEELEIGDDEGIREAQKSDAQVGEYLLSAAGPASRKIKKRPSSGIVKKHTGSSGLKDLGKENRGSDALGVALSQSRGNQFAPPAGSAEQKSPRRTSLFSRAGNVRLDRDEQLSKFKRFASVRSLQSTSTSMDKPQYNQAMLEPPSAGGEMSGQFSASNKKVGVYSSTRQAVHLQSTSKPDRPLQSSMGTLSKDAKFVEASDMTLETFGDAKNLPGADMTALHTSDRAPVHTEGTSFAPNSHSRAQTQDGDEDWHGEAEPSDRTSTVTTSVSGGVASHESIIAAEISLTSLQFTGPLASIEPLFILSYKSRHNTSVYIGLALHAALLVGLAGVVVRLSNRSLAIACLVVPSTTLLLLVLWTFYDKVPITMTLDPKLVLRRYHTRLVLTFVHATFEYLGLAAALYSVDRGLLIGAWDWSAEKEWSGEPVVTIPHHWNNAAIVFAIAIVLLDYVDPGCSGLLFAHHRFISVTCAIISIVALAAIRPLDWETALVWVLVMIVITKFVSYRGERSLRVAFVDHQLVEEQRLKTRKMLCAMLPEEVAVSMLLTENARSLVRHKKGDISLTASVDGGHSAMERTSGLFTYWKQLWVEITESIRWAFVYMELIKPSRHGRGSVAVHRPLLACTVYRCCRHRSAQVQPTPIEDARATISSPPMLLHDNTPRTFLSRLWRKRVSRNGGKTRDRMTLLQIGREASMIYRRPRTFVVSLLYFDLVGFTAMSQDLGPKFVVELLDRLYASFDRIVSRRGAAKVETIGDAFICSAGCPRRIPAEESVRIISKCAIDMIRVVDAFSSALGSKLRGYKLSARIGLHHGHVLAGVIGESLPRFQLFGPAVDICQEMEASSEPGRVHASKQFIGMLDQRISDQWRGGLLKPDRGSRLRSPLLAPRQALDSLFGSPRHKDGEMVTSLNHVEANRLSTDPLDEVSWENIKLRGGDESGTSDLRHSLVALSRHMPLLKSGARAIPDIKVVQLLPDGSGFIQRDRAALALGIPW